MLASVARSAAKALLRQAGLDTLGEANHARRRAEKAALALERARAEHATCDRRVAALQETLAGEVARAEQQIQQRYQQQFQQRIGELERQLADAQAAATSAGGSQQRRIAELERQHAEELAAAEERFAHRLNELKAHFRERVAAIVHDTTNARQELMMVEVKLDILEASINVLDRRTRVIGVLPSAVRPARAQPSPSEGAAAAGHLVGTGENGVISPGDAYEADAGVGTSRQ